MDGLDEVFLLVGFDVFVFVNGEWLCDDDLVMMICVVGIRRVLILVDSCYFGIMMWFVDF